MTRPVVNPDLLDSLDLADPVLHAENELSEVWRRLREERPHYWHPPKGDQPGFWVFTRHADAMTVYKAKEYFTTEGGNALATLLTGGDSASGSMLAVTDGEKHTQLRNVLNAAFSPRRLKTIRDAIRATIDDLILGAIEKGESDFVHDVSASVPLGAICGLMDVPEADRRHLLSLTSHAWSSDYADAPPQESWEAKSEILLYFADLAHTRRGSNDSDDVVSLLANCHVGDKPLSDADLMSNCYGLMIGGDETGRHAISGGMQALIEWPDQWQALKDGTVGLDTAANEVLRWTVPSLHGGRMATGDTTVNGQQVKKGDIVSVWISSANRDPEVFADPDRFVLDRKPNKHLTFAFGSHICLGHTLARIEVEEILDSLRTHVASAEQTGEESWIYSSILHGMSSLPVKLTPA
ncbi:cytochrome P450 [Amycolatopsis sp. OK19-0408]|uniref:Cytochrome P450 n=1 Tax=Amycolatopsis iheyensis TaxID=2945988 RepID=A0A9X2NHB9_9PSEU|nr:cytochrome P450 [Amycolatopsis iheyensis]MCR6488776.1 cytochrome P450 [Amycolatopsis iheyensis]